MAHARSTIRDAVARACTGLTTTGDRVYTDRAYPIPADKLPALRVFYSNEAVELSSMGADPTYMRRASLMVVGYAAGDGLDDTLDTIGSEVEAAIYLAGNLGGLAIGGSTLRSVDFAIDEGDSRTGFIAMTWEIMYRSAASNPAG